METLKNNYSGYNTYVIGSANNITESLEILLYNKKDFEGQNISLYNINQIYNKILLTDKYLILSRKNTEESFNYKFNNKKISGFNVIIFINNIDKTPTGYTEFMDIQGINTNLNINLDFISKISETEKGNLSIVNSLGDLRTGTSLVLNNLPISENLYDYVNSSIIEELIKKESKKLITNNFTTSISSLIKNNKKIYLSNNIILNENKIIKLKLNKLINLNEFENNFNNYQLGYYNNDLVIYSWDKLNYSIYSLTKSNKFGNPILYTDSNLGYFSIESEKISPLNFKILNFSNNLVILSSINNTSEKILVDLTNNTIIPTNYSNFVIDIWGKTNDIITFPNNINKLNLQKYFKDSFNYYYFSIISQNELINIIGKIGEWIILKKRTNNVESIVYTNYNKVLIVDPSEEIIPINDQVILIKSTYNSEIYYYIYNTPGVYYSELLRSKISKLDLELNNDLGIYICNDSEFKDKYKEFFRLKYINVEKVGETIVNSFFEKYRKNLISENCYYIPEIMESISGLIYYLYDNNLVTYL